jgi:hypothetical protein
MKRARRTAKCQVGDGDLVPPVRDRLPRADAAPRLRLRPCRVRAAGTALDPPHAVPRLSRMHEWMLDHSHASPPRQRAAAGQSLWPASARSTTRHRSGVRRWGAANAPSTTICAATQRPALSHLDEQKAAPGPSTPTRTRVRVTGISPAHHQASFGGSVRGSSARRWQSFRSAAAALWAVSTALEVNHDRDATNTAGRTASLGCLPAVLRCCEG